jgi:preprotein translocase subunit YajC
MLFRSQAARRALPCCLFVSCAGPLFTEPCMDWHSAVLLLAQEDPKKQPAPTDFLFSMFPLLAIFVVFYFLLLRPQRREQASKESMLAALKKNDKVVTIGGMIGTVANISADGQEVTLKVDDNTRIRMIRSSVQRVLTAGGEAEGSAETK